MSSTAQALAAGVARLRAAGVPDPAVDARRLMAHALGVAPDRLTLHLPAPLGATAAARFEAALAARAARRPVAQIVGRRAFYGRDFRVTADVLDPRPETETLVRAALEGDFRDMLDLGTGSGAILLSLLAERPDAVGLGSDLSTRALAVARANARDLGVADRARFVQGPWYAPVEGRFDLIVANPPYVSAEEMHRLAPEPRDHEPRIALTDDGDGLGAVRAIIAGARGYLRAGGALMLEIGPTQRAAASALLEAAGFGRIECRRDLDARPRVLVARAP